MLAVIQEAKRLAALGRREEAVAALRHALAEAPAARDARLQLARLANELGAYELAEQQSTQLTTADPRDSEAWCALGYALSSKGRPRQACAALERAVQITPQYGVAHRNLAAVLCDQERSEAAIASARDAARSGISAAVTDRIIARALVQLDRLEEAERLLRAVIALQPADVQALRVLGQLRHLRGDEDPLAELRMAARLGGAPPAVRMTFADLLRQRGDLAQSEAELRQLLQELGSVPEIHRALAIVMQERGEWPRALDHARIALEAGGDSPAIAECFVVSCMGGGAAAQALPVVERMRASFPRDQRWLAYRIDIARLRAESGFESWHAPEVVTQAFDMPERDELLGAVRELLESKHRHRGHPLDQSIRRGTQTARNLLVNPEPPLLRLFEWFETCLREYVRRLSSQLPTSSHATHPVLARAGSAPRPVGCWSVRLGQGGFHVNHFHPEGWLSSAFYVQVPEEAGDASLKRGWLKFGEPGQAVSVLPPTGFVQPRPGRLVLFPSYLWHGTTALTQEAVRLTVAFDALPEAEIL